MSTSQKIKQIYQKYPQNTSSLDPLSGPERDFILGTIVKNDYSTHIQNSYADSAATVNKYLFRETKSELGLFIPVSSSEPFYLADLHECLKKPVKVTALFDELPDPDSVLYQMLQNHIHRTKKGKMAFMNEKAHMTIRPLFQGPQLLPFIVSDQKRYQVEHHGGMHNTIACFNNNYVGRKLSKHLEKASNVGVSLT